VQGIAVSLAPRGGRPRGELRAHPRALAVPSRCEWVYCVRWALVGDAGCHKDPFLVLGVCDAFSGGAGAAGAAGA
jgi:hypothetical protein